MDKKECAKIESLDNSESSLSMNKEAVSNANQPSQQYSFGRSLHYDCNLANFIIQWSKEVSVEDDNSQPTDFAN